MATIVDPVQAVLISPDLKPCEHQAGGHFAVGQHAATFVDDSGKFYKLFQDDIRSGREASIYEKIFTDDGDEDVRKEDMAGLRPFVPKYFGIFVNGDKKLLALEDTCKAYRRPCVLDAKVASFDCNMVFTKSCRIPGAIQMGLTTIYPWSDGKYKAKNASKDLETTQSSLGFRVTGFKVWQQQRGENFVADRMYGKTLTADTMPAAFGLFGSNGSVTPRDIYCGPKGAVAQVRSLQSWFESQCSLVFFAASVLIVYEGAATCLDEVNVVVRFIDFAHTFPTSSYGMEGQRDENVLAGMRILGDMLERVGQQGAGAGNGGI